MQAIFPQEYFVYCKEKWCGIAEKGPLFGRVDGFQIGPSIMLLSDKTVWFYQIDTTVGVVVSVISGIMQIYLILVLNKKL